MITIRTSTETFTVDDTGNIHRPQLKGFKPSGQWKFIGLRRYNNFGNPVEYRGFELLKVYPPTDLRFKNGKPRWRVCDLDHGTQREWHNPPLVSFTVTP